MQKKPLLILIGLGVLIIIGIVFFFQSDTTDTAPTDENTRGVVGEPLSIAIDFYGEWLAAVQSTSTDPYASGLQNNQALSESLSASLTEMRAVDANPALDPVLCQPAAIEDIRAKLILEDAEQAQVLVLAKDKTALNQAQVNLEAVGDRWQITQIVCSGAETAPEQGEFSFEQEGFLLKSVPEPLDPQYWHLVFSQFGQDGHTVPLFFSADSTCRLRDGTEQVCNEGDLRETARVSVQGQLTEAGVEVSLLEFLN